MSLIFYYSNYCNNCGDMLQRLSQSNHKNDIHYLCIDNRVKKEDGRTYIILKNGQHMVLPSNVDKVPALLLLNRGNQVLFGQQILQHLQPVKTGVTERLQNVEPTAFSFNDMNSSGVTSDNYSFLDQRTLINREADYKQPLVSYHHHHTRMMYHQTQIYHNF